MTTELPHAASRLDLAFRQADCTSGERAGEPEFACARLIWMATVTFDTLELVDKLKAGGLPPEQAEAVVRVIAEAQNQLVTRDTLKLELAPVKSQIASLESDLRTIKWMMGFLLAGMTALIINAFFA